MHIINIKKFNQEPKRKVKIMMKSNINIYPNWQDSKQQLIEKQEQEERTFEELLNDQALLNEFIPENEGY